MALLEERKEEVEELAILVRNKAEVVKTLERRLLNAQKVIAEHQAEVQCRDHPAPQEDPPASQQQHQQTADIRVSTHSLATIHERYDQVLQTMKENRCSMACAFHLSGCPWSTLQDFVALAELKKVDSRELDLEQYEGQLLPMKFEARLYEFSIIPHKTAPWGATKSMKVSDQQ